MRYNEKELQALSRQPAEMAAELGMRGPKKGSDEAEVGASRARGRVPGWAPRRPGAHRSVPAPVSPPARRSPAAGALQSHPGRAQRLLHHYEFMRRSLVFYRNEIQKVTGKDPLEQFGISEEARFQLSGLQA
ncbi:PREDICTED: pleckstrin homology domain-containing family J member 1 isoform X3 [Rhinopithecus bieti]|uniref:pleckstrin homology domain-containing family J member 1 isoform X3 n=1 Tax=Rhinopithecus bieti TaxID=61621 RepID=UPI00083BC1D8|nr:PREDICTED: pleckstrin homology domain-containing family J member 1 isoform X3 [Rhinopithecus bieti]